ncbi:MAG: NAD-dependent deacetylase [Candidatus Methylacidiphilales bacterium]|nr:Sir2 family NAD-dependent protein deacetylase [Candidatus Methylacidiphilales bacterium]
MNSTSKLVVISGAGLSAESGISTFRDANGLWHNHRIEEICHARTWRMNFEKVHTFYNMRRTQLGVVQPNAGHHALARWEAMYDTTHFTQNIDNLLERADVQRPLHLHGFLTRLNCQKCDSEWDIGTRAWDYEKEVCPRPTCRSRLDVKPSVVFFGEMAPMYRPLEETLLSMTRNDVLLVIGTSGAVLPIMDIAERHSGPKILNNLHSERLIPEKLFNHVFIEGITTAVSKIEAVLATLLKPKLAA